MPRKLKYLASHFHLFMYLGCHRKANVALSCLSQKDPLKYAFKCDQMWIKCDPLKFTFDSTVAPFLRPLMII